MLNSRAYLTTKLLRFCAFPFVENVEKSLNCSFNRQMGTDPHPFQPFHTPRTALHPSNPSIPPALHCPPLPTLLYPLHTLHPSNPSIPPALSTLPHILIEFKSEGRGVSRKFVPGVTL